MTESERQTIKKRSEELQKHLFSLRNKKGVWDGYLSSSALAVAVATFSLWKYHPERNKILINRGLSWLKNNISKDGGYGDTIHSSSNLSTSLLCWSAFSIVATTDDYKSTITKLEAYLKQNLGSLEPYKISKAILTHYSKDKTFSVPILAMCAMSGRLGEHGWKFVPQLPYQFAALPNKFFRWLKLSVVSYALPALISMGLIKQKKNPSKNPVLRLINRFLEPDLLRVLTEKQPDNGGFLEAIPLTGFVLMTLIGAGFTDHIVCRKAEKFLQNSVRENGSWAIDISLTTWVSTLAINSLNNSGINSLNKLTNGSAHDWLIEQQHKTIHPFTKTPPGGWAWIDTQGGVADGDDTSGALIALKRLAGVSVTSTTSALSGLNWLLGIQNSDGGFPAFCRGWGKLPFDASCPDISAHAVRAIICWKEEVGKNMMQKLEKSISKAIRYLKKSQQKNGSWLPLWFGNEYDENHQNPVYGTSVVLTGLCEAKKYGLSGLEQMISAGVSFLINAQNSNGSWGGNKNLPPSIEETALAIKSLCLCGHKNKLKKSINWLISMTGYNNLKSRPIGLYFASLWYDEKMYPLVFALGAFNAVLEES